MLSQPSCIHQLTTMELSRQFANYLEGKQSCVLAAPFAVQLPIDSEQIIVQPDLFVICDRSKLDHHSCKSAPDFIIEITSTDTVREDSLIKLNLYQRAGVREYWIISPELKSLFVFLLEDGSLVLRAVYGPSDLAKVSVLDGCFIELSKVFGQI